MAIFISHSRQNASAALRLNNELNSRGVKTWLDILDLQSGVDWNSRVTDAMKSAGGFVFVLGPGEEPDSGQRFELQLVVEEEYYLESGKPLIPVVIGDLKLPGFLSVRKSVTLDPDSPDFPAAAGLVAEALNSPLDTVDEAKLQRGREARERAMQSIRDYVVDLGIDDAKLAGLRALK